MEEDKKLLIKAIVKILNPLVRILLRNNISFSEFVEIAKRSYVGIAYKHFSIPNRKKTYARVAVITGLNLKEVTRISKIADDELPETKGPLNRASQVISGWLRDADFLDQQNLPKILSLRSASNSFEELVARYSGDITARAILDELIRVGAVIKPDKDTVELVHDGFIPQKSESEKIKVVAQHTSDLLTTGVHNIEHQPEDALFQRQVTYEKVSEHVMQEFREYSNKKSIELLKDFDQWLAEHTEESDKKSKNITGRVGIGIYFVKNDKEG